LVVVCLYDLDHFFNYAVTHPSGECGANASQINNIGSDEIKNYSGGVYPTWKVHWEDIRYATVVRGITSLVV
jgi:hypothetical protein